MANKAVFLDRDNTLIEDPGYLSDPADVKLLPGVDLAVKSLRQGGYKVVVVTNQSGIARGLLTEERLEEIHAELRRRLDERGATLDAIYYCPYLPDAPVEQYAVDSDLRKPKPGMLLAAAKDLDLDLHNSWVIGDRPRDVEAGRRAGCRTVRIRTPRTSAAGEGHEDPVLADYTVRNLVDAARVVLREGDRGPAEAAGAREGAEEPRPAPEPTPTVAAASAPEPADNPGSEENPHDASDEAWSGRTAHQAADISTMSDSGVRREILRHVRQFVRSREAEEFSLSKLFAGILQVLVFMPLLLCIWKMLSGQQAAAEAAVWALLAILLQVMSLTFFVMHRSR
jgi:D-glycero-D-manno-heptose 1,7-bisphosphate phosphatase